MVAKSLTCPQCDAPLDPPAERTQFFCQFCGATVVIPEEFQTPPASTNSDDDVLRPAPDLSKFTIDKYGDELTISWSWRSCVLIFLVPFTLFWNGIAWTIGGGFLFAAGQDVPLVAGLIIVPHLCIGMFLLYVCLATFFNRTTIRVDRDRLAIQHGPLPWKSPQPLHVDDIQQLYVKSNVSRSKDGTTVTYDLFALTTGGKEVKLLSGQQDANTPQAVERMIEVHLDIEDRRVAGEF